MKQGKVIAVFVYLFRFIQVGIKREIEAVWELAGSKEWIKMSFNFKLSLEYMIKNEKKSNTKSMEEVNWCWGLAKKETSAFLQRLLHFNL